MKYLLTAASTLLLLTGCFTKQYGITVDGENLSTLTKVTDGDESCWTPFGGDGGRNLFYAMGSKTGNIYKKDNPSSVSTTQKTSGNNRNTSPTYCGRTDKLAFAGALEGATLKDIYMMNATSGRALTQVTNSPNADEDSPCFSPDGRIIVYSKLMSGQMRVSSEIWIKNLQTGENTVLGKGIMPSFSPDGKKIVYVKFTNDASFSCVWVMDLNGDHQVQLTDAKMGAVWHPRFSPDGRYIVFDCYKKDKKDVDLYIITRDGDNLTQLTINKSYDGQPYWANDGNIYFVSDRGGKMNEMQIWRFRVTDEIDSSLPTAGARRPAVEQYTAPDVAPAAATADEPAAADDADATRVVYHEVKSGETIGNIARRYGVSENDIRRWNKLTSNKLFAGTRLKLYVK